MGHNYYQLLGNLLETNISNMFSFNIAKSEVAKFGYTITLGVFKHYFCNFKLEKFRYIIQILSTFRVLQYFIINYLYINCYVRLGLKDLSAVFYYTRLFYIRLLFIWFLIKHLIKNFKT